MGSGSRTARPQQPQTETSVCRRGQCRPCNPVSTVAGMLFFGQTSPVLVIVLVGADRVAFNCSSNRFLTRLRDRIRHIVAVDTRGGSRMRESCTYGSVRGARGNSHPCRDAPMPNGCGSERCRDTRKEMNERCLDATPFTDGVPACCFNATLSKPIQFLSSFP